MVDRAGAVDALRALERESVFVFLDEARGLYRLHRVLASALRDELGRREPELARELHRRAARWHREHGEAEDAIRHGLAAGAYGEAASAIVAALPAALDDGSQRRLAALLEDIPRDLQARPRLALVRAWLLGLDGRRDEAEAELAAAGARLSPARLAPLARGAELLRAVFAWDGVPHVLDPSPAPLARFAAGRAAWWSGDLAAAADALEGAAGVGAPRPLAVAARATLALVELERGDHTAASRCVDTARAIVEEHGLDCDFALGALATAEGAALAALGQLAAALPPASEGLHRRRACGEVLGVVEAACVAAPLVAAVDGRAEAAELLVEARATLEACPAPGVLAERLVRAQRAALPRPDASPGVGADLSERELAVLRLLAEGLPKREIGRRLHLSFNTIHSHTKAIYRKLSVSGRGEAVACAAAAGLLGPVQPADRGSV